MEFALSEPVKIDILFLLQHDFADGPGAPYYCPECAQINGVLHYYPKLRHWLEVRYVDFPRPRADIIALIGEANQSCPVLVLAGRAPANVQGVKIGEHKGRQFVSGATDIGNYLSQVHNLARPH
ncbi:MAG: DUF3088 domain-containing protein [Verrucomicrobia bacterium]|nr:DUF3088 domain-containing protein [Verrucomicrobiota bacterium]